MSRWAGGWDGRMGRVLTRRAPGSDVLERGVNPGGRRPTGRPARRARLYAGRSVELGTASSAAAKPTLECVPSQNGFRVDAPHRQSVNGRLASGYSFPFQSTTVTSSPSTSREAFFRTVIFAMSCLSPVGDSPGLPSTREQVVRSLRAGKTRPPCAARARTFCLLPSAFCLLLLSSVFLLSTDY